MSKKLIEITSEIVQTQVSLSHMSAGEIAASLRTVFRTLQEMQRSEMGGAILEITQPSQELSAEEAPIRIAPADSIQENRIICLECGAEMKQLTQKHLKSHGMDSKEYKRKYGFSMRTPLAARSLTKARSKAARKRGLPENLKKFQEERKLSKATPQEPPSTPATPPIKKTRRKKIA
jgi:predicted transcriptional regulator